MGCLPWGGAVLHGEYGSGREVEQPADPRRRLSRCIEVRPDEPDDRPAGQQLTDQVLAALLPEHGVTGLLTGAQQPAVLDPSVELTDEAVLAPDQVGGGHQP